MWRFLESLFHDVDNLFQRFDAVGNRNVLFGKGMDCLVIHSLTASLKVLISSKAEAEKLLPEL